jgi:hypothetical protein
VLAFYLPLLIFPWIVTCVLMFRPIGHPAYINQVGNYTDADAQHMERWPTAVDVLNKLAAVLGVPIVSSLLAHAAVRYSQRRTAGQKLNLAQLFSLADRRWTNASFVWNHTEDGQIRTPLLLLGFLLVCISEFVFQRKAGIYSTHYPYANSVQRPFSLHFSPF